MLRSRTWSGARGSASPRGSEVGEGRTCVCGCVSWDFGGREAAPRRVGVRVCRLGVCVCVCVSGGGSRPASPQGARVPDRVRVGRGPASGTPERRGPPASRPGLRSLAGENRSAGIHAVDEGGGAAPTAAGSGRRGLGPRFPRPGPRQEARRPAARPNRLRARSPACPLARSPARPPAGLPRRSRDSVLARALGAAPGLAR